MNLSTSLDDVEKKMQNEMIIEIKATCEYE